MELLELAAVGIYEEMGAEECPYKEAEKEDCSEEGEEIEDDDKDDNQAPPEAEVKVHIERNNGSKLGANLQSGSQGASGTTIDPPSEATPQPKITEDRIYVDQAGKKAGKSFPYTVAAHHLIAGNASLKRSALYIAKSAEGSKVTKNIGYNVNGAHNGIFLPGWYGIRKTTSPNKKKWSEQDESWQRRYVAAVCTRTARQFHDSHEPYSNEIKDVLDSIAGALLFHKMFCEDCKAKEKTPPYYPVKNRLYALAGLAKGLLTGHPNNWHSTVMTSEKWTGYMSGKYKSDVSDYIGLNPIPAP